jgi:phosphoglycerate dehydrogenase-like enzyme
MRILIAHPICPEAMKELCNRYDVAFIPNAKEGDLPKHIQDRDVLIFRSGLTVSSDVMKAGRKLKLLIRAGSGTDNVDMDYVQEQGIDFRRIPGPGAQAVAEFTFGLMLGVARHIVRADNLWRQGEWAKSALTGYLLLGKTLGIVGAGNIGARVGQLGAAWGMQVIGCIENPVTPARDRALAQKGIRLTNFDEVITTADFLSLHVPLKDSTRYLMNKTVFSRMKEGSYIINTARGGVINEQDLYEELTTGGRLHGAALDVHEKEGDGKISPLAKLPNVILTPHIGAQAYDAQREIGRSILDILASYTKKNATQTTAASCPESQAGNHGEKCA